MSAGEGIAANASWTVSGFVASLRKRLSGPGGFYNIGNAVGLSVGLFLQIRDAAGEGLSLATSARSAGAYFVGNSAAVALTVATVVFFWSGEEYYRAWARGFPPSPQRTRRGDLLSGVGAISLGGGLLLLGNPILAATSGLLHAAGKFGSALDLSVLDSNGRWAPVLRDSFRWAVIVSRLPAMLIALIELGAVFGWSHNRDINSVTMPLTLLICYALWAKADLMLLKPSQS